MPEALAASCGAILRCQPALKEEAVYFYLVQESCTQIPGKEQFPAEGKVIWLSGTLYREGSRKKYNSDSLNVPTRQQGLL